jgi:hypothetical protein
VRQTKEHRSAIGRWGEEDARNQAKTKTAFEGKEIMWPKRRNQSKA